MPLCCLFDKLERSEADRFGEHGLRIMRNACDLCAYCSSTHFIGTLGPEGDYTCVAVTLDK